jgi:hypothetical protein
MKLAQRIREEFEETAGLRLTGAEAAGYFALELETCIQVFTTLYESGFLTKDLDGRYAVGFPPREELWQRSNEAGSQRRLKSPEWMIAKPRDAARPLEAAWNLTKISTESEPNPARSACRNSLFDGLHACWHGKSGVRHEPPRAPRRREMTRARDQWVPPVGNALRHP